MATTDLRTGGAPFYRDVFSLPPVIKKAIDEYVIHGQQPGHFVTAVLENDLAGAVSRADEVNYLLLGAIMSYVHNYIPSTCWGSEGKVVAWVHDGGWNGRNPNNPIYSMDWFS